jgi:hypothetical protein
MSVLQAAGLGRDGGGGNRTRRLELLLTWAWLLRLTAPPMGLQAGSGQVYPTVRDRFVAIAGSSVRTNRTRAFDIAWAKLILQQEVP